MRNVFPLVTICIPVYNGSRFLHQCIESAISQDYPNIEILVLDDCSTDNSMSVIEKYADLHPKIRVCQNLQNTGLVGNWNRCLELASGEWIQFMFQDDYFTDKDSIGKAMAEVVKTECPIVIYDRNYIFESCVPLPKRQFYELHLPRIIHFYHSKPVVLEKEVLAALFSTYFFDNFIGEPIVGLFKKDLLLTMGEFDSQFSGMCDFEFWLRLCTNYRWLFIPSAMVNFRVHQQSESSRVEKTPSVYLDIIKVFHKVLTNEHFSMLRQYLHRKDPGADVQKQTDALVLDFYLRRKKIYNLISEVSATETGFPDYFPKAGFNFKFKRSVFKLAKLSERLRSGLFLSR